MADDTHIGRGPWDGWIPGCPCDRCGTELQARQLPTLRLVLAGESPVGDTRVSRDESTAVDRWADEPRPLRAVAVALEQLVGPEPDNAVWLVEGATWDDRLHRAADILVEVSNRDASALRAATGGPYDGQPPPGHRLLVLAAIRIEQGTAQ